MTYRDELTAALARRDAVRTARSRLVEDSPEAMRMWRELQLLTEENARLQTLVDDLQTSAAGRYKSAVKLVAAITALMALAIVFLLRVVGR